MDPKFGKITYYNNMGEGYRENWAIDFVNNWYRRRLRIEEEYFNDIWSKGDYRIWPWSKGKNPYKKP